MRELPSPKHGVPQFQFLPWLVRAFSPGLLACAGFACAAATPTTHFWQTNMPVPTYLAAPPSPVPRFFEGRTYQGAKATFYPYPVQDVLTDTRSNVNYKALFLENKYIQVCVFPELGGRIFSALDKTDGYDFFYRQHVVKPALIGMLGAWISGGVEWNVPHHHRATSFSPVDYQTTKNADGSATVWVGETELRHHLKWMVGMTVHPGRSYLELNCKVSNPTPFAHPMLFWINPGVHANTNYQVIFPPSVEWTVQHGKPEFASWPIARQRYGGTDYTRGVDISWWKNHPTPVSFFAWDCQEDWFGGYDHGREAGVVQISDHNIAPGKKFFEWGNGPEGETWTRILSDEDGPYLELMAGAWSDNQPDYSWIQPGETREWKHFWYPVRNLSGMKAATVDGAANLDVDERDARIALNATALYKNARVQLVDRTKANDSGILFSRRIDISPDKPFLATVPLRTAPGALKLTLSDAKGRPLVTYSPLPPKKTTMAKPVERPRSPKDYPSIDELYFTAQRIEQLYSPSFESTPYYKEMLARDAGDCRAHTALGIGLCKQWRWPEAEQHLRAAWQRATANYIRPKDCEAVYYLGVALKAQGKDTEASQCFEKALWSPAWQSPAACELAELDLRKNDGASALDHTRTALNSARNNTRARLLRAMAYRTLDDAKAAAGEAQQVIEEDQLEPRAWLELAMAQRLGGNPKWKTSAAEFARLTQRKPESLLDVAFFLADAGQWATLAQVLQSSAYVPDQRVTENAMQKYLLAYALEKSGRKKEALTQYSAAAKTAPGFCFPSRFQEEAVLSRAMEANTSDATAPYLLGCLIFDNRPSEAVRMWEEARLRDPSYPLTHRNLALAYAQHQKNPGKAIESLEKAVALRCDPRFLYELDVQYEAAGTTLEKRLARLSENQTQTALRDDALTREVVLLTAAGKPARALELLRGRRFRNWEGSSQIHNVYVDACLARGRQLAAESKWGEAMTEYRAAFDYPENLDVGRSRYSSRAAQIHYLIGTACEGLGQEAEAKKEFETAAKSPDRAGSENLFYVGVALEKIGKTEEAKTLFDNLVKSGRDRLTKQEAADYFAKFGERQSERVRQAEAHYLSGLGLLGLQQKAEAQAEFKTALGLHPAHLGARQQL